MPSAGVSPPKLAPDGSTVVERTGSSGTACDSPSRYRALTRRHGGILAGSGPHPDPAPVVPREAVGRRDFHAVITDGIGTSTELLDGSATSRGATAPRSGKTVKAPRQCVDAVAFLGQYSDPETGLHYNYHRYYDPDTGRYAPCDLPGSDRPNHYAYVVNPLRWLDPLGLMSCGDDDAVTLYRNVDGREFDAIAETGRFESGGGSSEGKWFALHGEHADRWGEVLNQGDGVTMETNVPSSVVDGLHRHPGDNLDGIGPAVYADADQLEQINQQGDGIRIWEGSNSGHA